ncbi:reverse transcriptase, putative, partial [Ixodes scapularis]
KCPVLDYRRLNAQIIKLKYPLSFMDDQLEGLSGAKLYKVLDLAHGYLQVPLSDKPKTKSA